MCSSHFVLLPLPWVCNPTWACSYLRRHHKGKNIGQTKGWNKIKQASRQGLEKAHTQRPFQKAAHMQRRFKEKEAAEKGSQTNTFQLGLMVKVNQTAAPRNRFLQVLRQGQSHAVIRNCQFKGNTGKASQKSAEVSKSTDLSKKEKSHCEVLTWPSRGGWLERAVEGSGEAQAPGKPENYTTANQSLTRPCSRTSRCYFNTAPDSETELCKSAGSL